MKVFITGMMPTATNNLGDDAVFWKFCSDLKKVYKKPQITAAVRHPNKEYDKFFKVKSIKNLEYSKRKDSIGKFFYGFNKNDPIKHFNSLVNQISKSDIIFIGGSPFEGISNENILHGQANYAMLIAIICKTLKKNYVVYGAKFFSINNENLRMMAKFVLENASQVYLREEFSKKIIKKNKIKPKEIFLTGDPVISKEIANFKSNKKVIKKKFIGICFRHLYWAWDDKLFKKRIRQLQLLLNKLTQSYGYNLIMVPLQFYDKDTFKTHDIKVMKILKKTFKYKNSFLDFNEPINLKTVINKISQCDYVISNRRHICAFAAITGVTPIALIEKGNFENLNPMMRDLNLLDNFIYMDKNDKDQLIILEKIISKKSSADLLRRKCEKIFQKNSVFQDNIKKVFS